jgi:hypothetical protein
MNFAPFAFENSQPTKSITYIGNTGFTANQTSYTSVVNTSDIGLLVIGIGWAGLPNLTGITVNGNAASYTVLPQLINTTGGALYYYNTNVTSNTIVINFNGSVSRSLISCWLLKGVVNSTPNDAQYLTANAGTSMTTTLSPNLSPTLGISIQSLGGADSTLSWSGATKNYGTIVETANEFGGANFKPTTTSNYNITTTWTSSLDNINISAIWF